MGIKQTRVCTLFGNNDDLLLYLYSFYNWIWIEPSSSHLLLYFFHSLVIFLLIFFNKYIFENFSYYYCYY